MKTKQKIWKTIQIGGRKEYTFNKDIYISDWAKDLQSKTPLAEKKEQVDLVILTPQDLGFTESCTTTELFDEKNLAKYGVELCPAEVGLALREQYSDQPNGEWLWIAMNPITDSDGSPSVWDVERSSDGRRWLDGGWVYPGSRWGLGRRIVFRLRKSSALKTSEPQSSHSHTESSDPSAEVSTEASLEERIEKIEQWIENVRNQLL